MQIEVKISNGEDDDMSLSFHAAILSCFMHTAKSMLAIWLFIADRHHKVREDDHAHTCSSCDGS